MSELALEFDRVGKAYRRGVRQNSLRAALVDAARRGLRGRRSEEFWALRDLSFSCVPGESFGIIGGNGSGKSTSLRLLTGITSPSAGVVRTRGRVAGLLEVGTGFHGELTGRQNLFLTGSLLGMTRRDIRARFDDIVEFAGIGAFLDTPLKRYSTGMHLRLGFAVAAHLDPDILVVDEVLAVGDVDFQRRCLGHLERAHSEGRTVVLVSHDLDAVRRICDRALWLDRGAAKVIGMAEEVVSTYLQRVPDPGDEPSSLGQVVIHRPQVFTRNGQFASTTVLRSDPIVIAFSFETVETDDEIEIALYVSRLDGVRVLDEVVHCDAGTVVAGRHEVRLEIPAIFNVGDFAIGCWFRCGVAVHDDPSAASFTVTGDVSGRPERVLAMDLPMHVSVVRGAR